MRGVAVNSPFRGGVKLSIRNDETYLAEGPLAPNDLPDYARWNLLHENVPESPPSVEAVSVGSAKGLGEFVCRKRTTCSLGGIR